MLPLIALGAAIAGAAVTAAVTNSAGSPEEPKKKDAESVASPRSYLVTPVDAGPKSQITAVEAVQTMIF